MAIQADGFVRSASVHDESGQSQFAPLKLRSLALVPSSGALTRPSELHSLQLHCKILPAAHRRSGQKLAAVQRSGSGFPATIQRHPDARVRKKRSSARLCPAEPSRDLRLGLSVPSSPSSRSGRHTRCRAIKGKRSRPAAGSPSAPVPGGPSSPGLPSARRAGPFPSGSPRGEDIRPGSVVPRSTVRCWKSVS